MAKFPGYEEKDAMATILWIILIGFVAGIIARLLSPGPNNPGGGQLIGWYRPDQGARFIGATLGALIILFIWNRLVAHRIIHDPAADQRRLP